MGGQELRTIFSNAGANLDSGTVTRAELDAMTDTACLVALPSASEEESDIELCAASLRGR
jgi:hypothetical protein